MAIRHKTLSMREVLEYVALAVFYKDAPDGFDGKITCDWNSEEETIDVYVYDKEEDTSTGSTDINNHQIN